jgi:hypothetical protein
MSPPVSQAGTADGYVLTGETECSTDTCIDARLYPCAYSIEPAGQAPRTAAGCRLRGCPGRNRIEQQRGQCLTRVGGQRGSRRVQLQRHRLAGDTGNDTALPRQERKLTHPPDQAAPVIIEADRATWAQQAGLTEVAEVVEMSDV